MPEVFRQLQELDEKRIRNIRNFMTHSADVERKVFPIMEQCLDGIVKAASQINEKEVYIIFFNLHPIFLILSRTSYAIIIKL